MLLLYINMGFFSSISHAFSSATHAVSNFFSSAGSTISSVAHSTATHIEDATKTIYSDAKSGVSTLVHDGESVLKGVKDTADNVINKTTGILTWPLILIGVGVVVFAYNSRSNFTGTASINR